MSYQGYGSGASGQDPYGRGFGQSYDPSGQEYGQGYGQAYPNSSATEPSGYVSNDPYALPTQQPGVPPLPYSYQSYSYDALHPPRPSVGFAQAFKLMFKNYANFYGRASRSEFWWVQLGLMLANAAAFTLFITVGIAVSGLGAGSEGIGTVGALMFILMGVLSLGLFVPMLSLQVRRLHDAGFSGFVALVMLIPYVGWIVPYVMCCLESKPEGVKYDDPSGAQPAAG